MILSSFRDIIEGNHSNYIKIVNSLQISKLSQSLITMNYYTFIIEGNAAGGPTPWLRTTLWFLKKNTIPAIRNLKTDSLIHPFSIQVLTVGMPWRVKTTEDTNDTTLALKKYTPQEDNKQLNGLLQAWEKYKGSKSKRASGSSIWPGPGEVWTGNGRKPFKEGKCRALGVTEVNIFHSSSQSSGIRFRIQVSSVKPFVRFPRRKYKSMR